MLYSEPPFDYIEISSIFITNRNGSIATPNSLLEWRARDSGRINGTRKKLPEPAALLFLRNCHPEGGEEDNAFPWEREGFKL
jgi:hypothetical protein